MLIVAPLGGKVLWLTSVIYGLPPVTAGIGVWLAGVGQAGMYGTAERMKGWKDETSQMSARHGLGHSNQQ